MTVLYQVQRLAAICAIALIFHSSTASAYILELRSPVIVSQYYEQNGHAICDTTTRECGLVFSAPPRLLLLKELHCVVTTSSEIMQAWLSIHPGSGIFKRGRPLFPAKYYTFGNQMGYYLDLSTEYLVGSTPKVTVMTIGDTYKIDMDCQITGKLQ